MPLFGGSKKGADGGKSGKSGSSSSSKGESKSTPTVEDKYTMKDVLGT